MGAVKSRILLSDLESGDVPLISLTGCTLLKRCESCLGFCFKEGGGALIPLGRILILYALSAAELPPDVIILVMRFPQMNWDGSWHRVGGNHIQSNPTRRVIP